MRLESVRIESVRLETVRIESVRLETVRLESVRLESVKLLSDAARIRMNEGGFGKIVAGTGNIIKVKYEIVIRK